MRCFFAVCWESNRLREGGGALRKIRRYQGSERRIGGGTLIFCFSFGEDMLVPLSTSNSTCEASRELDAALAINGSFAPSRLLFPVIVLLKLVEIFEVVSLFAFGSVGGGSM